MNKRIEVLSFINKFKYKYEKEIVDTFMYGYCYWFAHILSFRFKGDIWFNPYIVHFATRIDNTLYDIRGEIILTDNNCENEWISWKDYQFLYPEDIETVVSSCIKKDSSYPLTGVNGEDFISGKEI